jgi:hypothetical protein
MNMSEATDHLLHQYFHGYGKQHVAAERRLREMGPGEELASQMSNAGVDEADPVVPLMKSVLSTLQSERGGELDAAMSHMDQQAESYEGTQTQYPRPDVLASDLNYEHGARAVPYLAVRLMKEPDWPAWKVAAVLQYLAMEKDEKALPALARFTAENKNPGYQRMIAKALEAFDARALEKAKREEERYQSKIASGPPSE